MIHSVITIARQYGSGGRTIGKMLADSFEIPFYDKELIAIAAKESGLSAEIFAKADERATNSLLYSLVMGNYSFGNHLSPMTDMPINDKLFMLQSDIIKHAAEKGPCVIVGRCADYILREHSHCFNVFIYADPEDRAKRIVEEYGEPAARAEDILAKKDKQRANYYNFYSNKKWGNVSNYHLCVNSSAYGLEKTAELIRSSIELLER